MLHTWNINICTILVGKLVRVCWEDPDTSSKTNRFKNLEGYALGFVRVVIHL